METAEEIVGLMNGANTATQAVNLAIGYLSQNPKLIQNAAFFNALESALAGTDERAQRYQNEVLAIIPEEQRRMVFFTN
ncbi:hypothetical protein COT52_00095 [candidate division WWE3 bacterium CG08_land_8_20_14_0_20_43_13]|uniref:Uncharacterized protein n=1 Tax=candidate division WWE3 bacterium CG08_land_8_20_14_0_20_43_13 TaxID=1975087 RepID=A0A2H0X8K0_UNCKA|nr:MAG: hypothetical protein COT52_00095 [candidate division WWE3 bacterium CG08_land_8_20_14_0_20_43_13]